MSEEQIFDEAYKLYYRKCLLFAQSYTHDMVQAEDIVAEAMIVLWEKLCNAEEIGATLPFLIGTIRNKILNISVGKLSNSKSAPPSKKTACANCKCAYLLWKSAIPKSYTAWTCRVY